MTERMEHVRSVALGFWIGVGSRDEADTEAGASHFLEHLLFKGTPSRSAQEIAEAVDAVGGDINAFTTKEYTAFEARVLDDASDLALDVLSDIVWSPAFRPTEVESERQVILEELLMQGDEPADEVHDLAATALFPGHPLGRSVLGTEATIGSITRETIDAFHHMHYRPAVAVVAAAGRVEHEALVAGVDERLAAMGGRLPDRQAPPDAVSRVEVIERDTEQTHLVVACRGLDRDDDDRYVLWLLEQALGGGLSSRLFQQIREQRGLAYSVYSWRAAFVDAGAVGVYAGTAPANTAAVLELIHQILDEVVASGITERELAVAKGHVRGSLALGLEDSGARMARIGRAQLVHGRVPPVNEMLDRIERVSLADVARVASRVLGERRVVAAVGPVDGPSLAG